MINCGVPAAGLAPPWTTIEENIALVGFLAWMSTDWVSVTSGMLRVRGLPVTMTSIPLSSTCTEEMVGIHYFPFSLYFPQLFFMEVTYFPTGFHFLMCHGIYLEYIMIVFSQVRTLSVQ